MNTKLKTAHRRKSSPSPVSESRLPEARYLLVPRNVRNLYCLSVCMILLETMKLMTYGKLRGRYASNSGAVYVSLHVLLLLFGLCSLLLAFQARRNRRYMKRRPAFFEAYVNCFAFVLMMGGSVLTLLDQPANGQIVTFVIHYVMITALLVIAPRQFWKLQALPCLSLLLLLPVFQKDPDLLSADYINLAVLMGCASFNNYCGYASFCRSTASRLKIGKLAGKDELTGLNNRRGMRLYIEKTVQKRQTLHSIGVIMFDVDYFKKYNDYYGHAMGDQVLSAIGAVLNDISDQNGVFSARYGGEEFIVILRNRPLERVSAVAEEIRDGIRQLQIENKSSELSDVISVSIGQFWTRRIPSKIVFSTYIEKADAALYCAKRGGRNRIFKASA